MNSFRLLSAILAFLASVTHFSFFCSVVSTAAGVGACGGDTGVAAGCAGAGGGAAGVAGAAGGCAATGGWAGAGTGAAGGCAAAGGWAGVGTGAAAGCDGAWGRAGGAARSSRRPSCRSRSSSSRRSPLRPSCRVSLRHSFKNRLRSLPLKSRLFASWAHALLPSFLSSSLSARTGNENARVISSIRIRAMLSFSPVMVRGIATRRPAGHRFGLVTSPSGNRS